MYTFDLAGRLVEAFVDGVGYRRGLDGRVLERRSTPGAEGLSRRVRRHLSPQEAHRLTAGALQAVWAARAAGFPRIAAMDGAALEEDARRFKSVYRPIGILPPDQYLSVVLQLTCGCWYNRCTFCTFYRDRRFAVRSPRAFRAHVRAVKAFLGPGLSRRHTVFLGDANAVVLPTARLLHVLETVREELAGRDVYAFLDAFSGRRRVPDEWASLRRGGLRRVYVGAESGSGEVLRFLQKPGEPGDVLETVRALKAGGVSAGVILLLGAGGRRFAREHVRESVALVDAMELGAGDQLLLSPLVIPEGSPYERAATAGGVEALSPREARAQAEAILSAVRLGRGARWSHYFVEEFLY